MFVIPFGPLLAWKRGDLLGVAQRLMTAFAIGMVAIAIAFAVEGEQSVLAPFGVGLTVFVILGALIDLVERTGLFGCRSKLFVSVLSDCRVQLGAPRSPTLA